MLGDSAGAPSGSGSGSPLASDEGFIEEDAVALQQQQLAHSHSTITQQQRTPSMMQEGASDSSSRSVHDTEELAYKLLASLPRSRLATIQRRIAPLLQFDVVGSLPTEVSLQIFSYLPCTTLLDCGLVSRRWQALANDQSLWKALCQARGWTWRHVPRLHSAYGSMHHRNADWDNSDDEGMGDSDEEEEEEESEGPEAEYEDEDENFHTAVLEGVEAAKAELTMMQAELDSGFASMATAVANLSLDVSSSSSSFAIQTSVPTIRVPTPRDPSSSSRMTLLPHHPPPPSPRHLQPPTASASARHPNRYSAPSVLQDFSSAKPNYKLLHQTHVKLRNRVLASSYRLSPLQTRGAPSTNTHTSHVYCLQLYTYPETGKQVLFTGSRDRTVREWNLSTGVVERVIADVHTSSVLSICVHNGYLASAGSDRKVALWHLETNKLVKVLTDHEESVLCVRFDDQRLVSCSKDRTVRIYSFPSLEFQFVLGAHRAAVNAVSISDTYIVSASGDRSVRLWDAETGKLLRTLNDHHTRGIASIDFCPPFVVTGSSDKHVRFFDMHTQQGWSTDPKYGPDVPPSSASALHFSSEGSDHSSGLRNGGLICQICGSSSIESAFAVHRGPADRYGYTGVGCHHTDLVRTVAFGEDFVLSGSYDLSVKVWDRKTGYLVANLTGGHTGRIFCIGFDAKKIVSCGEDQRICIWDFSHGIDTSFIP